MSRLRRRTFLAGSAMAPLVGCASPEPFDPIQSQQAYPPLGEFVSVDGLQVHYWSAGEGTPVVLVHGASGNLRDWTFSIAPELARTHRVIVFDRPGFGYSDRPAEQGWNPAVQAVVLKKAADALGVERPILVGHSWGGALVLAWALDHPEAVAGVVPVSAVAMPYGGLARVVNFLGLDGFIVEAYSRHMLSTAREGGVERFLARVFRPQPVPEGYADYVGAPLALRQSTLLANGEDLQYISGHLGDMAPRYAGLGLPVEVIHGQSDFVSWDHHAGPLAERLPRSNLTLLPGVGHMAHHAAPGAIAEAIARIETVAV